jgi:hypothetical protein
MGKTMMIVTLPSGKKLLFGSPPKSGLHEVSAKDKLIESPAVHSRRRFPRSASWWRF